MIRKDKLQPFCKGLRNLLRSPPRKPTNDEERGRAFYFALWTRIYQKFAMSAFELSFSLEMTRKLLGDSAWAYIGHQRHTRGSTAPDMLEVLFRIATCHDRRAAEAFCIAYLDTPEARRGEYGPRFVTPAPDDHFWHLANALALFHAGDTLGMAAALDELAELPPRKWRKYSDPWLKAMTALAVHCLTAPAPDPWDLLCSVAQVNEKMFAVDIKDLHYDAWFAEKPLSFAAAAQQRGWDVPDRDPHPSMPLALLRLPPVPVPDYPWDQPPAPDPELVRAIERVARGLPGRVLCAWRISMDRMPRSPDDPHGPAWARELCHPLPMGAVLVLALNDHVLKGSGVLPGWLTGKLSDVAGLFFFPLLLTALAAGALHRVRLDRLRLGAAMAIVTGAAFSILKLSPGASAWASRALGPVRPDPTDLIALPLLALSYAWMRRAHRLRGRLDGPEARTPRGWLQAAGVLAAALASLATSAPRPEHPPEPPPVAPCARIRLVGCEYADQRLRAMVEVMSDGQSQCRVELTGAQEKRDPQPGSPPVGSRADELPPPFILQARESRVVAISWSRPSPVVPGEERFTLDVDGNQWRGPQTVGAPMWSGHGRLEGVCAAPRPAAQVAQ